MKYLDSVKHITERLGRWYMLLSGYKYRIEHIKGSKNVVADTLSRIGLPTETEDTEDLDEKVAIGQICMWMIKIRLNHV